MRTGYTGITGSYPARTFYQEESIKLIAQATGEFLLKALSDISVDKTCLVIPPPAGPFECDDKVDALKMVWNGPATLESVTAYRGDVGSETLPADISTEEIGEREPAGRDGVRLSALDQRCAMGVGLKQRFGYIAVSSVVL